MKNNIITIIMLASALIGVISLTSGAAPTLPAKASSQLNGSISVGVFEYLPAKANKLKPNQVASIGGPIAFERNIDAQVRDAVIAELKASGVQLETPTKILSAEIESCQIIKHIDGPADCALSIKYRISSGNTVTYESTKDVETRKCSDSQLALDDVIEQNLRELVKDSVFLNAIK